VTNTQMICTNCDSIVPDGHDYCGQCGAKHVGEVDSSHQTLLFGPIMTPGRAKLILIKGTDDSFPGLSFHLNASHHKVGRKHGKIPFPDDMYVSPKHADFFYRDNTLFLKDEGSLNGSFIQLRRSHKLEHGDHFMIGHELFKFELMSLDQEFMMSDETMMYVSPHRPYQFRLVQVLEGGKPGRVHASPSNETIVGREGCDINIPNDRHVSRRHAKVHMRGGDAYLDDLGSRNGTYLKIVEESPLQHGDYVFIGEHLLRVEITA